jgi:hypothetical protein
MAKWAIEETAALHVDVETDGGKPSRSSWAAREPR